MELYLYIFRYSILEARPSEKWLRRCRWYAIKEENSGRFKTILNYLESVDYPRFTFNFKGNRYFGVVKAGGIRESFAITCPDLLYDVIISPDKIESLEGNDSWRYERYKFGAVAYAIYLVGLETKASSKITEVKEKFKQIYEKVKNEIK